MNTYDTPSVYVNTLLPVTAARETPQGAAPSPQPRTAWNPGRQPLAPVFAEPVVLELSALGEDHIGGGEPNDIRLRGANLARLRVAADLAQRALSEQEVELGSTPTLHRWYRENPEGLLGPEEFSMFVYFWGNQHMMNLVIRKYLLETGFWARIKSAEDLMRVKLESLRDMPFVVDGKARPVITLSMY